MRSFNLQALLTRRQRRRAGKVTARGLVAMTLLEIMIVLAILALVMGFLVGPRVFKALSSSKVETARNMVKKFAFEAYTDWSAKPGSKGCPQLSDLTEFMKEDSELILKASDKYLHELFFVDRKDYFQNKEADGFLAEAHARLTTPLLNIVMALLAIVAVLGGDFSRQGYSKRIGFATGAAALVLIVQLALQSEAANDPALNAVQWAVPLLVIASLSWVYFGRGRNIGKRPPPMGGVLISRDEAVA